MGKKSSKFDKAMNINEDYHLMFDNSGGFTNLDNFLQ